MNPDSLSSPHWQIIEEPRFEQQIDELEERYPRLREIKEGLSEYLRRGPRTFDLVPDTPRDFYTLQTDDWPIEDVPIIQVVYYVDDYERIVYLLALRMINEIE